MTWLNLFVKLLLIFGSLVLLIFILFAIVILVVVITGGLNRLMEYLRGDYDN